MNALLVKGASRFWWCGICVLATGAGLLCGATMPPMPPMPPGLTTEQFLEPTKPATTPMFRVTCPHCQIKLFKYHALAVETNAVRFAADGSGGKVIDRTIHFVCPNADCHQQFKAKNVKLVPFAPDPIAVEEPDGTNAPSAMLKTIEPLPSTIQPDAINPNLRLRIYMTNFTNAVIAPVTVRITADGGRNQPIPVVCGKCVAITFPTQTEKLYTCQSSDNAGYLWDGSNKLVGNGSPITLYETMYLYGTTPRSHRIYRVIERTQ